MTIQEFSIKYKFKHNDRIVALKMYNSIDLPEGEWVDKLKNEFTFDHSLFSPTKIENDRFKKSIVEEDVEEVDEEGGDESQGEAEESPEPKIATSKEEKLIKIKDKKKIHHNKK